MIKQSMRRISELLKSFQLKKGTRLSLFFFYLIDEKEKVTAQSDFFNVIRAYINFCLLHLACQMPVPDASQSSLHLCEAKLVDHNISC